MRNSAPILFNDDAQLCFPENVNTDFHFNPDPSKNVLLKVRHRNKFSKSQNRKLADLPNLLDLQTFGKCGNLGFAICRPIFSLNFRLSRILKNIKFLHRQ
jgi:hypothetical protein